MENTPQQSWRHRISVEPTGGFTNRAFSQWTRGQQHPPRFVRRGSTSSVVNETLPPKMDLMDGLEEFPLVTITIPTTNPDEDDVRVKDWSCIGSYSWVEDPSDVPTILIPGSPPIWKDRTVPYNVAPDTGIQIIDYNRHWLPNAILLPLIEVVNSVNKSSPFEWPSVDIVTDRNNIRKLFKWVKQSTESQNFRIDLQLAGEKTVLMNRWHEANREPFSGYTFRYNFEKASTDGAPGCKDATNYQRIVSYDLHGLKMVVRFEPDVALLPPSYKSPQNSISSVNEVTRMMNEARLSRATQIEGGQLHIIERGIEAPTAVMAELSTRSQRKFETNRFDWSETYASLFFSQISHHLLGIHNAGQFVEVQKRTLTSPDFQAVEYIVQEHIKKICKTFDVIKKMVIEHGRAGRLSLVCVHGELRVYKRTSDDSCLPEQTLRLFQA